jgi:hypothetical protein
MMRFFVKRGIIPSMLGLMQTTDFFLFVGSFFAQPGEKRTYKRRKVPSCLIDQDTARRSCEVNDENWTQRSLPMWQW